MKLKQLLEYYGDNRYGGYQEPKEPTGKRNGKPTGAGNIKKCGNCKGVGHFGDDEPSDDDYCVICAGTGKVAMKANKQCSSCNGKGHTSDEEGHADKVEISDDDYCYECAGTGKVTDKGIPQFNKGLDGNLTPPPG